MICLLSNCFQLIGRCWLERGSAPRHRLQHLEGGGHAAAAPNKLGIRYFSIVLPDSTELERVLMRVKQAGLATEPIEQGLLVRDPSQIAVVLTALS